jgi:hypothetical protein
MKILERSRLPKISKPQWIQILVVTLVFATFLGIGLSVYHDYGISTDERIDYDRGKINYIRLRGGSLADFQDQCSINSTVCSYPPFFSMVLYRAAPFGDWYDILYTRHLVTFLFFLLSVFFFYLINKKIFNNWLIGLLGAIFLFVSPRIFANSFFNPKDLPFLSAYVIAMYTMLLFIEKKNIWTAILHGIALGASISIRIPGVILLPITALFYLISLFFSNQLHQKNIAKMLGLGLVVAAFSAMFIYSTFPILYTDPINNFISSYKLMSNFPWSNYHLFMGQNIKDIIPWYYSIVWFSIGTPIFYVIFFWIGLFILSFRTIRSKTKDEFSNLLPILTIIACGVLPIISVIISKSVIYTDNRQMFFCYPALLISSLIGIEAIIQWVRQKTNHWKILTACLIVITLGNPTYFMIRYHPFQNAYFNILAGSKMSVVKERFGFDGWCISNKQGLLYLLNNIPEGKIRVSSFDDRDFYTLDFLTLPKDQRDRFIYDEDNPEYILNAYRYYPKKKLEGAEVFYSFMVGDAPIMTIYKVNP